MMYRKGILRIGYVENLSTYQDELKRLAGVSFYNYDELDDHIDALWERKDVHCFNSNFEQVDVESSEIIYIALNTGMYLRSSNENIYIGYKRRNPGFLDEQDWKGISLGSLSDLIASERSKNYTEKFSERCYIPEKYYTDIARVTSELSNTKYTAVEVKQLIAKSFDDAVANGEVVEFDKDYSNPITFFPLNIYSKDNERMFLKSELNARLDGNKWFNGFVETETVLRSEMLEMVKTSRLHIGNITFTNMEEANAFLSEIANKAMKEDWVGNQKDSGYDYPILRHYINNTFIHLQEEDDNSCEDNKLVVLDGYMYFNTGLLDRNFRQLFVRGAIDSYEEFIPGIGTIGVDFLVDPEVLNQNDKIIAQNFSRDELPKIATYFKELDEIIFNADLDIRIKDDHVLEDGISRGRIPKYYDSYVEASGDQEEIDHIIGKAARDFDSAIERAKLLAERNYKLAVPQYREGIGIQFLLPIYIGEREEADMPLCALVLSLDDTGRNHYYRGETVLTLDMAYNNARLIAKPDVFWLN